MDLGRLALRGTVGPLFVGHGTQKLFGWFGGGGREGTGGMFESLGLRPGRRHATAAGLAEATGGALLTLGALTPLASGMVSGTMITAIRKAHAQNGPWVTNGGWEYPVVLVAVVTALAESGPGRPSVDAARFPRLKGRGLALLQLAAAGVGSYLVTERFADQGPAEQEQPGPAAGETTPAERDRRFTRDPAQAPAPSA